MVRDNGNIRMVPGITISKKNSDYFEIYNTSNRLDLLSSKYYNNPNYEWLILLANPEYGSLEYNIPFNSEIRIPYPLNETLKEYEYKIHKYFEHYK
jgi:hypothetical protein